MVIKKRTLKERFIPVQINQELCMHCERCVNACREKAIYFENSVRRVDYSKCKGCLTCQMVCPRNAVEVTSVEPNEVVSIKIDHEKCTFCRACLENTGKFCPKNLFYEGLIKKKEELLEGIKFKFKEILKCQGCLRCEALCPEGAIIPIIYEEKT